MIINPSSGNRGDKVGGINPNLLDNAYFGNPVNQRGGYVVPSGVPYWQLGYEQVGTTDKYYTVKELNRDGWGSIFEIDGIECNTYATYLVRGYVGGYNLGYTIDRWKTRNYAPQITLSDGYLTFETSDYDAWYYFEQPIEKNKLLNGVQYTMSILTDTGLFYKIFTCTGGGTADSVWFDDASALFYDESQISTGGTALITIGSSSLNKTIKIRAIKLELGTEQTLAHQDENGSWVLNEIPDYHDEFLKCIQSTADSSDAYANKVIYHTGNKPTPNDIGAQVLIKDTEIQKYGISASLNNGDVVINSTIEAICEAMPVNSLYTNGWTGNTQNSDNSYRFGTIGAQLPLPYGKLYIYKPRENQCDLKCIAYDKPVTYVATWTTTNNYGFVGWESNSYSYGTTDLVAGSSFLDNGKLYFVYE